MKFTGMESVLEELCIVAARYTKELSENNYEALMQVWDESDAATGNAVGKSLMEERYRSYPFDREDNIAFHRAFFTKLIEQDRDGMERFFKKEIGNMSYDGAFDFFESLIKDENNPAISFFKESFETYMDESFFLFERMQAIAELKHDYARLYTDDTVFEQLAYDMDCITFGNEAALRGYAEADRIVNFRNYSPELYEKAVGELLQDIQNTDPAFTREDFETMLETSIEALKHQRSPIIGGELSPYHEACMSLVDATGVMPYKTQLWHDYKVQEAQAHRDDDTFLPFSHKFPDGSTLDYDIRDGGDKKNDIHYQLNSPDGSVIIGIHTLKKQLRELTDVDRNDYTEFENIIFGGAVVADIVFETVRKDLEQDSEYSLKLSTGVRIDLSEVKYVDIQFGEHDCMRISVDKNGQIEMSDEGYPSTVEKRSAERWLAHAVAHGLPILVMDNADNYRPVFSDPSMNELYYAMEDFMDSYKETGAHDWEIVPGDYGTIANIYRGDTYYGCIQTSEVGYTYVPSQVELEDAKEVGNVIMQATWNKTGIAYDNAQDYLNPNLFLDYTVSLPVPDSYGYTYADFRNGKDSITIEEAGRDVSYSLDQYGDYPGKYLVRDDGESVSVVSLSEIEDSIRIAVEEGRSVAIKSFGTTRTVAAPDHTIHLQPGVSDFSLTLDFDRIRSLTIEANGGMVDGVISSQQEEECEFLKVEITFTKLNDDMAVISTSPNVPYAGIALEESVKISQLADEICKHLQNATRVYTTDMNGEIEELALPDMTVAIANVTVDFNAIDRLSMHTLRDDNSSRLVEYHKNSFDTIEKYVEDRDPTGTPTSTSTATLSVSEAADDINAMVFEDKEDKAIYTVDYDGYEVELNISDYPAREDSSKNKPEKSHKPVERE